MSIITYLTKERYMLLVKKYEGGHWTPNSINQRWEYHSRVVELLKTLNISTPKAVLEMGTMGISCVINSDTIDYLERWDFPGKKPTYVHDSRITPWPIKDKQYEVFIALRVFQHLTPFQKEATKEAMRIARKVIIAVPDIYKNKEISGSRGIAYTEFVDFLNGIHPTLYFPTSDEYIYYWDFDKPSTINLEAVMRRAQVEPSQALLSNRQEENKKNVIEKTKTMARALKRKGGEAFRKIIDLFVQDGRIDIIDESNKRSPSIASHHIEFIGPAGVGKSTLCEKVKKSLVGDWLYKVDVLDVLPQFVVSGIDEDQYLQLLISKSKNLNNYSLTGYQKLMLLRYFSDVLLNDLAMNNKEASSRKYFIDDGVCQNFSEELISLSDFDLKAVFVNRALVFVQSRNSHTIINQIRKREKETGRTVVYHTGFDDNALREHVELSSSMFVRLVDRAEVLGVPICKIFAEDDFQMNVKKILQFEKRFVRSI